MKNNLPLVSIIIPCRNEEKFINKCLESIMANDYPKDRLEILVVDGMSEDRTRKIMERYTQQYSFIRLLDNPKKITPCAFNMGIKHANGEFIMIMSAHAACKRDYILKCIKNSQKYNADNVGGMWRIVPRDNNLVGKAITLVLSHPFGVGNAYYRIDYSKEPRWVDTAAYGCYRRDVFKKIGFFNEKLIHSQDMDFNLRLKRAGGKTLLVPDAIVYYYARSDFKSFCKHNFRNGVWAIYPMKYVKHMPVSYRHLIPLVFVSSLVGSAIFSSFSVVFLWLFLFIVGSYSLANFYFSCKTAFREKNFRYLFIIPIMFASFHIGYGLGSIWGAIKLLMPVKEKRLSLC